MAHKTLTERLLERLDTMLPAELADRVDRVSRDVNAFGYDKTATRRAPRSEPSSSGPSSTATTSG